MGEGDSLMEFEKAVVSSQINVLVIQFNYGFFNFDHFRDFLHHQKLAGLKIFVVLHATNDPPHAPHKKLSFWRLHWPSVIGYWYIRLAI